MQIRALVFDDDEGVRLLISSIFEMRGYEVLSFTAPRSCPIYLDKNCPCPRNYACADILITDNHMPGMTGLDFIEHQTQNGCKVICKNKALMSSAWTDQDKKQVGKLGCHLFDKPFGIEEVHKWLEECENRINAKRKLIDLTEFE